MIDLRSDTVTQPTAEMREAAQTADVGDDVFGEDPSVAALEERAATLLGKEAALYLPSGTMANQVAALSHTHTGQEVIVEERSHIYTRECGGLAALGGVQARPLDGGDRGLYTPEQLEVAIDAETLHQAGTGLICIENTHNRAGGRVHTPDAIDALRAVAADHGLPIHLDGARIWNAAVALDTTPARLAASVDSVMASLSKGLGAPVGSLLAGEEGFIDTARRHRKRLGGGMRQAGVIAAPALVGLEHWERLGDDHERAARLASALEELYGLDVTTPETNIVLIDVEGTGMDAYAFASACAANDVGCIPFGPTQVRCCTHRDVDDGDIAAAIEGITRAIAD